MQMLDEQIKEALKHRIEMLEERFASDVVFFYRVIHSGITKVFRDFVERTNATAVKPEVVPPYQMGGGFNHGGLSQGFQLG